MARTYIPKYKGYVTDVPKVWFKRKADGKLFHFDQLSDFSAQPQIQFNEVNAGWSLFPVAYLPGQSTFEISMTSLQFDASLFELSNGTVFGEDTINIPVTGNYDVTNKTVVLKTKASILDTLTIDGMVNGDTAGAGVFVATETEPSGQETEYTTTITITDDASSLEITYFETKTVTGGGIDNRSTAIGEMTMMWPVYGSGDEENAIRGADIKGYIVEIVYRARITQGAGFQTSYKNVSGNQITVGAMDPHRADERIYYVCYYDKEES